MFIDNYITETEKTNLNAIDKFYVDVVYDQDNYEIVEDRRFKTEECLEKHLPRIKTEY